MHLGHKKPGATVSPNASKSVMRLDHVVKPQVGTDKNQSVLVVEQYVQFPGYVGLQSNLE